MIDLRIQMTTAADGTGVVMQLTRDVRGANTAAEVIAAGMFDEMTEALSKVLTAISDGELKVEARDDAHLIRQLRAMGMNADADQLEKLNGGS